MICIDISTVGDKIKEPVDGYCKQLPNTLQSRWLWFQSGLMVTQCPQISKDAHWMPSTNITNLEVKINRSLKHLVLGNVVNRQFRCFCHVLVMLLLLEPKLYIR